MYTQIIRDKKELRVAYESLKFFLDCEKTMEIKNRDLFNDAIVERKREIRRYLKEKDQENQYRKIIILGDNGGWDHYIELIDMASEDEFQNQEEAEKYFEDVLYIHYRPTYYDCTGQLFTGWYKVFKRNGRWTAYHYIKRDI